MRQHHERGSHFLLCLSCDRGEWRKVPRGESVPCRHCGGATEERWPVMLALPMEDRGLLRAIAEWSHTSAEASARRALAREFRRLAGERSARGKSLPQWAAEWLQNNPRGENEL